MKNVVKGLLQKFEKKVVNSSNWFHIPGTADRMFYIAPHLHKGRPIELPCGTTIRKGDQVAEIHLDNLKTDKLGNANIGKILRFVNDEFDSLHYAITDDERFSSIKAYHGLTLFHVILKRQGFTILDVRKTVKSTLISLWMNILRIVFSPKEKNINTAFRHIKEYWVTKEELLERQCKKRQLKK